MHGLGVGASEDVQVHARDSSRARGPGAQQPAKLRGERIRWHDAGRCAPGDGRHRAVLRRLGEAREIFRGVFDHVEAQPVESPEAHEQKATCGGPRCFFSRLRGMGVTWPASPLTTRCWSQSPMTPPSR